MIVRAVSEARLQMERIMLAAVDIHYFSEVLAREHQEMSSAIRARDPERARRKMHDHIMQSKDKVLGVASILSVGSASR
jgi:DNA-binding GntR family transcriptional regulator